MKGETKVPIFNLADLKSGLQIDELRTCLHEKGLFYLTNYGMLEAENELLKIKTIEFFEHGTEEERTSVIKHIPGVRRGYSKLESESTAQVTDNGNYSDYSMCYSMGVSGNLFPSKKFEHVWTNYFNRMYSVSQEVAKILLEATNSECGGNVDEFLNCDPLLRFRYFPEVPEQRCAEYVPLRMAPHYDLSIVTLIHQTPCANGFVSLQYDEHGTNVDLPFVADSVLVMCGAVATIVSNGKIKAPIHCVSAPPTDFRVGSSRTSSVFFLRPKSSFTFSVQKARDLGFNVSLTAEKATFNDWIGGNYNGLQTQSAG